MRTLPHPRRASPDHPARTEPTGSGGHDGTHDTELHGRCGSDEAARIEPSRPGRHHRTLAAGLALAGAAALTACTPASHPAATAPSSAPSATASPTPSLPAPAPSPTQPPEMTRDDETGAVAAARYMLDLYAYAEGTHDLAQWKAISHDECVFCRGVADDVAQRQSDGQVTRSGALLITSQEVRELNPLAYSIVMDVTSGPDAIWTTAGRLVDPGRASAGRLTIVVVFHVDRWIIREVQVDAAA